MKVKSMRFFLFFVKLLETSKIIQAFFFPALPLFDTMRSGNIQLLSLQLVTNVLVWCSADEHI